MNVKCKFCQEQVDESQLKVHVTQEGGACRAALETVRLLGSGLRPLPPTHTLPSWARAHLVHVAKTRGKYEGEPRAEKGFTAEPTEQHWIPRWADIIVELWGGPIYTEGEVKQAQRDGCLEHVYRMWSSTMKTQIVDAYKEDLRAVRDLLKQHNAFVGDPPMLLSEFEKQGRFQDPHYHKED